MVGNRLLKSSLKVLHLIDNLPIPLRERMQTVFNIGLWHKFNTVTAQQKKMRKYIDIIPYSEYNFREVI